MAASGGRRGTPRCALFFIANHATTAPKRHSPQNIAERAAPTGVTLNLLRAEAADGGRFGIVHVEDGEQLGYLKHFLKL